ncbi:putative ABC transporter ATP-binding protein [Caenibius tardaugens NBRC 16725]|uniref:Putative ABC transporter ATP-binding protein n=1 Tax=Caenibius tardaugens NBRC 16725 TaxID=1219035 RepID=U2ZRX2_9SPHN|nr:ABC-F family ATP-binding cassette domain-containing protein [Caenibius tardaugens]AZI34618.1 ABC-F family ATP-binding cassette domain-containing protein [Caenibius tardaugens NBRC 16725]GAD48124.1 putative ABC transporter ATP-binding protein [Caenibius tardaugens NBRC 16725]
MPAFLTFDRIAATRPDGTPLFSGLTLALGRERVGLVGRNGSGKSTLLAIAAGLREPANGTVTREGGIGLLEQVQPEQGTVARALGVGPVLQAMARLEAGHGTAEDAAIAEWDLPDRLALALEEVGLPGLGLDRDVASLSGGERTRLGLAAVLLKQPDVLLLDEPTNNLDQAGREAIRALLQRWHGGALVVSHDRALLDDMDRIVALSPVGVTVHGGGWTSFVAARDAARALAEGELDQAKRSAGQQARSAQKQAEKQARRDKAGRATKARGDLPRILLGKMQQQAEATAAGNRVLAEKQAQEVRERLDAARQQVEVVTPLTITLPPSHLPANRTVLALEQVMVAHDGRHVAGPVSLTITGPERVALRGANGSGKTSLLRVAMGTVEPAGGVVRRAEGGIAMLDQHVSLLVSNRTLVENIRDYHPEISEQQAYEILARFAFRNREAQRLAGTLSGGERLRAGLAMVFSGPHVPQVLVLDEPTNHLDVDAIEELEHALAGYDGALIVVSHDRNFLSAIGIDREIVLG